MGALLQKKKGRLTEAKQAFLNGTPHNGQGLRSRFCLHHNFPFILSEANMASHQESENWFLRIGEGSRHYNGLWPSKGPQYINRCKLHLWY